MVYLIKGSVEEWKFRYQKIPVHILTEDRSYRVSRGLQGRGVVFVGKGRQILE